MTAPTTPPDKIQSTPEPNTKKEIPAPNKARMMAQTKITSWFLMDLLSLRVG